MGDEKEHGVNAVFGSNYLKYNRKSKIFPLYGFKVEVKVKYGDFIVNSAIPPIRIPIKLVTINKIEVTEGRSSLTVAGRGFNLTLFTIKAADRSINEVVERLQILVLRQRIPHSILGLPFEWEMELQHQKKEEIRRLLRVKKVPFRN
ncbi:unnamed protein product [Bursaphelenchus xylophilus]|uniref:(pine wood nematode) hypothetical protein n=1 Tax=Bursaphelenchus xylophilus TaxID=6326 RepID=A0A811L315_BURXY|nr:unnamed protein product [Bursaphelenchus xylophilus]CAG9108635.1 unnamed protein product [Bursaphelenchus xylophilus]